jgi:hypothetical protein
MGCMERFIGKKQAAVKKVGEEIGGSVDCHVIWLGTFNPVHFPRIYMVKMKFALLLAGATETYRVQETKSTPWKRPINRVDIRSYNSRDCA